VPITYTVYLLSDFYLLLILFLTDRSSFGQAPVLMQLIIGYVPLAFVMAAWAVVHTMYALFFTGFTGRIIYLPLSTIIKELSFFAAMVWPTALVTAYNFY